MNDQQTVQRDLKRFLDLSSPNVNDPASKEALEIDRNSVNGAIPSYSRIFGASEVRKLYNDEKKGKAIIQISFLIENNPGHLLYASRMQHDHNITLGDSVLFSISPIDSRYSGSSYFPSTESDIVELYRSICTSSKPFELSFFSFIRNELDDKKVYYFFVYKVKYLLDTNPNDLDLTGNPLDTKHDFSHYSQIDLNGKLKKNRADLCVIRHHYEQEEQTADRDAIIKGLTELIGPKCTSRLFDPINDRNPLIEKNWDVFISYPRTAREHAVRIYGKLIEEGFERIWLDTEKIIHEQPAEESINPALLYSNAVLFICTEETKTSTGMQKEAEYLDTHVFKNPQKKSKPKLIFLICENNEEALDNSYLGVFKEHPNVNISYKGYEKQEWKSIIDYLRRP